MPILFADKPCADSPTTLRACVEQELPTDWFDRANTFTSSLGRGPGRGWILLARSELDAISLTADHNLTFFGGNASQTKTLKKITLIGAQNLTPGALGDARAVYLCEVVDRRYHLARIPVNAAYNVRSAASGDLLEESLNSGTAWTWAEVVEDLWDLLDLGTVPTLPFTPDGDPENLAFWGGWAWDALNDVLDRIGCTVRYWAVEDTFTFVRLGATDSASDAEADRLVPYRTWDSEPFDPARAWRPEKVRVRFLRHPMPADGSSPYYVVDVTLDATAGVVTGSFEQMDDDNAALGATGAPTNAAACATRAAERAADWLRKRRYSDRPELIVYRDIQNGVGTLIGSVRGTVTLEDRIGARTAIRSAPDAKLERWRALTGVPKWWPPGGSGAIGYYRDYSTPTDVYTLTASSQFLTVPIGTYLVIATMNVSFAGGAATVHFGFGACNDGATPASPKIDTTPARTDGASGAFVTVTIARIIVPEEYDDDGGTPDIEFKVYKRQTTGSGTNFDVIWFNAVRLA